MGWFVLGGASCGQPGLSKWSPRAQGHGQRSAPRPAAVRSRPARALGCVCRRRQPLQGRGLVFSSFPDFESFLMVAKMSPGEGVASFPVVEMCWPPLSKFLSLVSRTAVLVPTGRFSPGAGQVTRAHGFAVPGTQWHLAGSSHSSCFRYHHLYKESDRALGLGW